MKNFTFLSLTTMFLLTFGCTTNTQQESTNNELSAIEQKANEYVPFTLTTDLTVLSENQRKMIPILVEVARIMDELYWKEAYGDKEALMAGLTTEAEKKFVNINYGSWDRLRENEPFIETPWKINIT